MTEKDGHEMIVARMKALETIALRYISLHNTDTGTYFFSDKELKELLEQEVEKLAGWRH